MSGYVSPELERMARRCKLPIRASYIQAAAGFRIWSRTPFSATWHDTPAEATRAYFDLVESLDRATSFPGTKPAADRSAPSLTPEGVR